MSKIPTAEEAQDITLAEARQHNRDEFDKGTTCWSCGQFVKLYRRKLNAGMARSLILAYRMTNEKEPEDGWIHLQKEFAGWGINANATDYSSLKWWDLIEPQDINEDPTKKTSGFWRVTPKGREFAAGNIRVNSHMFLFNNKKVGSSDEFVTIREALGDKFDYEELMTYIA